MALTLTIQTPLVVAAARLLQLCDQAETVLCLPYDPEDPELSRWFLFGEKPTEETIWRPRHLLELTEQPSGQFGMRFHLRMGNNIITRPLLNAIGGPVMVDELDTQTLRDASQSYHRFEVARLAP